jgi:hypothetical protein
MQRSRTANPCNGKRSKIARNDSMLMTSHGCFIGLSRRTVSFERVGSTFQHRFFYAALDELPSTSAPSDRGCEKAHMDICRSDTVPFLCFSGFQHLSKPSGSRTLRIQYLRKGGMGCLTRMR